MDEEINLTRLARCSLAELEKLYVEPRPVAPLSGRFRGHHLCFLDTPEARHPLLRPILHVGFVACPFGIDFSARLWFFLHRKLAAGRFEQRVGPSRWRAVDTVQLHYQVSRLPRPVRGILYDEVKPLSDDLCLGLGGINRPDGRGDCFFFALARAGE